MTKKIENMLFAAWAAAFTAVMGSLYFSEIRGFEPCELCWYQRIFMYPLVVILLIAIVKKDAKAALYSAILSGIGGCISIYHYSIQKFDALSSTAPACGRVPCTGEYINLAGFITIPFLALTAFVIIFILSMMILKQTKGATQP
ncbi:disulfide oxidoreductase [Jeotgalibacillus salarius]|uniref:Disulfide bond formation protein B n=1 Tax=Jeotgalibacillus salarius TaxID=546023 RepID=A0A4Y8L9K3_9BACL|nr:disulfide oxidoreductase [Jeotgalibacillus salarius]TFD97720.1 disulfide bond formation protein B [Jeotgalibacillus salarius]